jgi:hypothetical protein
MSYKSIARDVRNSPAKLVGLHVKGNWNMLLQSRSVVGQPDCGVTEPDAIHLDMSVRLMIILLIVMRQVA